MMFDDFGEVNKFSDMECFDVENFGEMEGFDPRVSVKFSDLRSSVNDIKNIVSGLNPIPLVEDTYDWVATSRPVIGIKNMSEDIYSASGSITKQDLYASDLGSRLMRRGMTSPMLNNAVALVGEHQNDIFRGYNKVIDMIPGSVHRGLATSHMNIINYDVIFALVFLAALLVTFKYFTKK